MADLNRCTIPSDGRTDGRDPFNGNGCSSHFTSPLGPIIIFSRDQRDTLPPVCMYTYTARHAPSSSCRWLLSSCCLLKSGCWWLVPSSSQASVRKWCVLTLLFSFFSFFLFNFCCFFLGPSCCWNLLHFRDGALFLWMWRLFSFFIPSFTCWNRSGTMA